MVRNGYHETTAGDPTRWQLVVDQGAEPGNVLDALAALLIELAARDHTATNDGGATPPPHEAK